MKWFNKLERKLGRFAIPNLMLYIIILYGFGFAINIFVPGFYTQYLSLNAEAIIKYGQIWRLVTFIIQPPSTSGFSLLYSILLLVLALYLYYSIGRSLEYAWGSFRFNLYFFTGVLMHIIAAMLTYFITGLSLPMGTYYLNLSLFFAYATIYPNQRFYVLGILPIKVKWLAWIDAAYFGYAILQAFLPAYGGDPLTGILYKAIALEAFVSILNFLIFFLLMGKTRSFGAKEIHRKHVYRKGVREGRKAQGGPNGARHRCHVCGRTELDDPNLEFRYCSKCNGNYEYCQDHLFTHEHIK